MTSRDQSDEPVRPGTRPPDSELGEVGFAAPPPMPSAGMVNVEVTDHAGAHRVLMVRFPRTKLALGGGLVAVIVLGLPWFIAPFMKNDSGLPGWAISLAVVFVLTLAFGWILVPIFMTAIRGGYVALTPTGMLIRDGLGSVMIPWRTIESADAGTTTMAVVVTTPGTASQYPVLRLRLRSDHGVPGWPWPAALSPVLLGSSRRSLRIPAWWLQPVPLNWIVALVGFLLSHPEERQRIGNADPGEWDLLLARE